MNQIVTYLLEKVYSLTLDLLSYTFYFKQCVTVLAGSFPKMGNNYVHGPMCMEGISIIMYVVSFRVFNIIIFRISISRQLKAEV